MKPKEKEKAQKIADEIRDKVKELSIIMNKAEGSGMRITMETTCGPSKQIVLYPGARLVVKNIELIRKVSL